ncbi:hypothetical protein [Hydrogenivirga sp.]
MFIVGVNVDVTDNSVWRELGAPRIYEGAYEEELSESEYEDIEELIEELLYLYED